MPLQFIVETALCPVNLFLTMRHNMCILNCRFCIYQGPALISLTRGFVMSRDRKNRLKLFIRLIGGIVSAIVIVIAVLKFWIVPSLIHSRVTEALSGIWDGEVRIGRVEVKYFGPLYLKTIAFYDSNNHKWFQAEAIEATLKNWPSLQPIVTAIEIKKPQIDILFTEGGFLIPFRSPPKQPDKPQKTYFELRDIFASDITLTLSDGQDSAVVLERLVLSASREKNFYNISLSRLADLPPAILSITGTINPVTFDTALSLKLNRTFRNEDVSAILAVLNLAESTAAQGQGGLAADLTVSGSLKEPASLQGAGTVEMDNWRLTVRDHLFIEEFNTTIRLEGSRLESENFAATFCKGHIDGSFYADIRPHSPMVFGGSFFADKIDLAELTGALSGSERTIKGTIVLKYEFQTAGPALKNLQGRGEIFLDDAELRFLPIIPDIFRAVGLPSLNLLQMSDAAGIFDMSGAEITIKDAHIANRFVAIEVEPGGTINVQNGHIDLHVIGIPFRQIDTLIKNIPIVSLFADIKDKLVRLRVQGHWSGPPAKLITKEPLKDIKEGTIDFFTDAIKTGGRLSETILKKLGILLQQK